MLFCLRALWQYAERHPWSPTHLEISMTGDWSEQERQVTFRFTNPFNRGDFLGEATRLLAGKWTRVGMSDDAAAS